MIIHVTAPGESAYSIAQRYGVSLEALQVNNGLGRTARLAVGQALLILTPDQVHVVGANETLYSISRRYNIPLRTLLQNNYILGGQDRIWPGQTLVLSYTDQPTAPVSVSGYAYPFVDWPLLYSTASYLTYFIPFTYGITSSGGLVPLQDETLILTGRTFGAAPVMHLSTLTEEGYFSTELAHRLLSSPDMQETLIEAVLDNLQKKQYEGLDVDFEYIGGAYRDKYSDFIELLQARLKPYGYFLIIALAPKERDDQPGELYEGHDYARLGAASDAALLMTYEWGYAYGPPMAVSPINKMRQVLDYAVTRIPRKKIYLGMPNYGYDWPLPYVNGQTRAKSISHVQAAELAVKHNAEILYDETAQAPHFTYRAQDGVMHEVWFEDPRSILSKLSLISEYGLEGAGYWNMMRPFPANWLLLNSMFQIRLPEG